MNLGFGKAKANGAFGPNFQTIQRRKLRHNKRISSYEVNPNNNPLADLPQHAHIAPTYTTDSISDAEGLKRAYAADSGLYSFNDRLYIAGTKSLSDIKDDITKIPAWGDSRSIQRYQDATEYLKQHPNITEVSGHSLGGSVALQLQKDNDQIQHTRTYGAPALDFGSMLEKNNWKGCAW
jgi:hypothetical protein